VPGAPLEDGPELSDGVALVRNRRGSSRGRGRACPLVGDGLARVLFWSVGGLIWTGGKSGGGGVWAWASEAVSARKLAASKSERRRVAAVMVEDMVQTSV